MSDVTRILSQIDSGDPSAADALLPLVYDQLRKLAEAKLAQEGAGQTLNATALVHEAYLRLVGDQAFADRGHFFRVAAESMRRILIDPARRKLRTKHGGRRERVPLSDVEPFAEAPVEDLLALDEALVSHPWAGWLSTVFLVPVVRVAGVISLQASGSQSRNE